VKTSVLRTSLVNATIARAAVASGAIAPANGATMSSSIERRLRQSTISHGRSHRQDNPRCDRAATRLPRVPRAAPGVGELFERLQQERELRTALVAGERVNLIDDDVHARSVLRYESIDSISASDSGVVISTCGGRAIISRRSSTGVSPVRTPVRTNCSAAGHAARSRVRYWRSSSPISRSGRRRFTSTS